MPQRPPLNRYFFDTEFVDEGEDFSVDFISIGIVAEDGREFYGVSKDFNEAAHADNEWIEEHVLRKLPPPEQRMSLKDMREKILDVIEPAETVEFWAKNGSYDNFILCRLFGGMAALRETLRQEKGIERVQFRDSNELRRAYGKADIEPQNEEEAHVAINDVRQERLEFQYYERFTSPISP
jgi:hypothetical protein